MISKIAAVVALAPVVAARVHLDLATLHELESLLEHQKEPAGSVALTSPTVDDEQEIKLPEFFDFRTVWWGCGESVHNQGQCGSCWAASATSVLNDRYCIHMDINDQPLEISRYGAGAMNRAFMEAGSCDKSNSLPHDHGCTKRTTVLSPQRLVSCATKNVFPKTYADSAGCNGGDAGDAWHYFHTHGVSTMSGDGKSGCTPYVSGMCLLKDPKNNGCLICEATYECADTGLAPKFYKVGEYGRIRHPDLGEYSAAEPVKNKTALAIQIRHMKEEIFTNGPIQTCFEFPKDFQQFFNEHPLGIYNSTEGVTITGSHCVTITGWGTDAASGMDFWMIRNSWGEQFGTRGYYRWIMGTNLGGLEHEAWTGCPLNSKTCKLTRGVQIATSDDNAQERPVPWNSEIAHGGKWMDHAPESDVAQQYAHELTKHQVEKGALVKDMLLSPGDYQVKTVQTRVTNGVVARVVMSMPGANGDDVEALLHHNWDNTYSVDFMN